MEEWVICIYTQKNVYCQILKEEVNTNVLPQFYPTKSREWTRKTAVKIKHSKLLLVSPLLLLYNSRLWVDLSTIRARFKKTKKNQPKFPTLIFSLHIKDLIVGTTRLPGTQQYQPWPSGIKPNFTSGAPGYFTASRSIPHGRGFPTCPKTNKIPNITTSVQHWQPGLGLIWGRGRFCSFALWPAEEGQRNQQWFFFFVHHEN